MKHTLAVCRLPERTPIEVDAVEISSTHDSWAWSVQLTPSRRADHLLIVPTPEGPREIEVAIDGHVWTFVIENVSERRNRPQKTFSASGRSRSAALAAPYATARTQVNAEITSAAAAATAELEFTGFALDWRVTDWTLPPGAWAYTNLTPMGALLKIAEACGAVVQSHPSDLTIIVRPAYEVAPWNWESSDADVALDAGSVTALGMEWRPGPQYLGVYVSGESQGVLVNVIRTGSAGSPYAQMVVDPMITEVTPAIGRGIKTLADSERQLPNQVAMPLMPGAAAPGVIRPCELVEITDEVYGINMARAESVTITAGRNGTDSPLSVTQSVTITRHLSVAI